MGIYEGSHWDSFIIFSIQFSIRFTVRLQSNLQSTVRTVNHTINPVFSSIHPYQTQHVRSALYSSVP